MIAQSESKEVMRVLYIVGTGVERNTRMVYMRLGKRGDEPVERESEFEMSEGESRRVLYLTRGGLGFEVLHPT